MEKYGISEELFWEEQNWDHESFGVISNMLTRSLKIAGKAKRE
jgi:hypothetical protein